MRVDFRRGRLIGRERVACAKQFVRRGVSFCLCFLRFLHRCSRTRWGSGDLPLQKRSRRATDKQDQCRQFVHSFVFVFPVRCDWSVITIFTLPINRPVLVFVSNCTESPTMLKSARWIVVRSCELRTRVSKSSTDVCMSICRSVRFSGV